MATTRPCSIKGMLTKEPALIRFSTSAVAAVRGSSVTSAMATVSPRLMSSM